MKADYNSLIVAYESNQEEIENIISASPINIAMEADNDTPEELNSSKAVSDTVRSDDTKVANKSNLITKVLTKVRELIKKVGEIFSKLKNKLSKRISLTTMSDNKFKSLYVKKKTMVKPYDNVKVITYSYSEGYVDKTIKKILGEIIQSIDKLKASIGSTTMNERISKIINADQGEMIKTLVVPYIHGDDKDNINNIKDFIRYIIKEFRGEKKEIVYHANQIPQIEAKALSTKELAGVFNGYMREAETAYKNIKSFEFQVKRTQNVDEKVLKLVMANTSKATVLYNAYDALVHAYFEARLEQCLAYRLVLKKFYQF